MKNEHNLQNHLLIFGIPLAIIGVLIFIAKSPIFLNHQSYLSTGITFDLLFIVPLVYFLFIRNTNIPKITVVTFFILGIILSSLIFPLQNQHFLNLCKIWVLPIVEISILVLIIFKIRMTIKKYNENKTKTIDFFTALKNTANDVLPKAVVTPVITEIAVFYYGFIYWKKRKLKDNEFTYHKDSGTIGLFIAILFVIAVETYVLHVLLARWNTNAAWFFTLLSVYTCIQFFGFLKSIFQRPISIEKDKIFIRYGIMKETIIQLENIECVEISSKDIESIENTRKLSFLGDLESHNLVIKLKDENTLIGLYGIKRNYKNLALFVDDKHKFKIEIDKIISL